jgi:hypothetical protein
VNINLTLSAATVNALKAKLAVYLPGAVYDDAMLARAIGEALEEYAGWDLTAETLVGAYGGDDVWLGK